MWDLEDGGQTAQESLTFLFGHVSHFQVQFTGKAYLDMASKLSFKFLTVKTETKNMGMYFSSLVAASIFSGASEHTERCPCSERRRRYLLAGHFGSVSHRGPLLLIGGNLNVVTVASIVTVPE